MSDKELTIDGLKKLWNILFRLEHEQFMDCVNDARELLEQSEQVRHGHWIDGRVKHITKGEIRNMRECSECGACYFVYDAYNSSEQTPNYCPACGCKMDEVSE